MQTASPQLYKILLTGPAKVGKTSLLEACVGKKFNDMYIATIGIDFDTKKLQTAAGNHVSLQIWDTAGDERFSSITTTYYRGAQASIVVFDLTNLPSFTDLPNFVQKAKDSAPEALVFIVGTHASSSTKEVQTETAKEFASRQGLQYREVDSSTGFGIEDLFELVASSLVLKNYSKNFVDSGVLDQLEERIEKHVEPFPVETVPSTNPGMPPKIQNFLSLLGIVDGLYPSSGADSKSSVDLRISMGDFDQLSSSTSSIKLCYQDSYETSHDRNNSNLSQEESAIVLTFIPNPSSSFSSSNYEEYFKEILDTDTTKGVLDMLSGNTFKWDVTADYSLVTLTLKFATSSSIFGLIKPITDMITKAGISPGALLELLFSESYQPTKNLSSYTSTSSSSEAGIKAQFRIKAEMSKNFLYAVARLLEKTEEPGPVSQLVSTFKKLHFDLEFDDIKKEVYDLVDKKLRKADAPADTFKDFETIKTMLLNPFILSKFIKKSPTLQRTLGEENVDIEKITSVLPALYTKCIELFAGIDAIKLILGTENSLVIKTNNIELIKLLPTAEDLLKASKDPNLTHLFTPDTRVLMLGLDGSGKTAILYKLKLGEVVTTIPTIGFNVETIEYKKMKMVTWDVGGGAKIRVLWRHYLKDTNAVIYVVDSYDTARMSEAKEELTKVLAEPELDNAILLVFCNKQDSSNALSVAQVTEQLGLNNLNRPWFIQPSCATTGEGLFEGIDWVVSTLKNRLPL